MDLLLCRYGSIDFVLKMDFDDGIRLIDKAMEKSLEERLFTRWIPYQENIGFEDFKNILISYTKHETKEEILNRVKGILEMKVGE